MSGARWMTAGPALLYVLVLVADRTVSAGQGTSSTAMGVGLTVANLLTVGVSLRAARHPALAPAERRPWRLIAVAALMAQVSGVGFALATDGATLRFPSAPMTVALAARAVLTGTLLAALLSFTSAPLGPRARWKLISDVSIVLGGGLMVLWYFLVGPALSGVASSVGPARFIAVLFPIADLALLVGLAYVLIHGAPAAARGPLLLLTAGSVALLGQDLLNSWLTVYREANLNTGWNDAVITLPPALILAAAIEQCVVAGRRGTDSGLTQVERRLRPHSWLPYAALAVGYGMLAVAAARAGLYPWTGLVAAAIMMTLGVAARQVISLRENHALVVTDSLTGLANRVRLRDELGRAIERNRRTDAAAGMLLIDLDGFKQVNDAHGHAAGDRVLIRFAEVLRSAVRPTDTPARLGGDEFAVVLDAVGDATEAVRVAERILAAARQPAAGTQAPIELSIGVALTDTADPAGQLSASELARELTHQADLAMYVAKRRGTHSWEVYSDSTVHPDLNHPAPASAHTASRRP